jgi:tRNA pseudouridine38-40 synthase
VKTIRIALWVWYRGDFFRGFQSQLQGPTVQDSLVGALTAIGLRSKPCPAGRTDKGVHARMQIISLRSPIGPEELLGHLSPHPFPGLGISYARRAPEGFHAQWSNVGKEYRYRIRLGPPRVDRWTPFSWTVEDHPRLAGRAFDLAALAPILRALEGTRDFAAFHQSSSPRRTRTVRTAQLVDLGNGLAEIRITGDRFARYQVRFMVGGAVAVATGAISPDAFAAALAGTEAIAGIKAPAAGLVLWDVHYPPAIDPFGPEERREPDGLPAEPPFASVHC